MHVIAIQHKGVSKRKKLPCITLINKEENNERRVHTPVTRHCKEKI